MELRARFVGMVEEPDENYMAVVLAESDDGVGERLELQRALTFDAQDRRLGQDTYCVCLASGATHYGGVASWSLAKGVLKLQLERSAAAALGVDAEVVVRVAKSAKTETLRSWVVRVLSVNDERPPKKPARSAKRR